jgi:hypothetical protein
MEAVKQLASESSGVLVTEEVGARDGPDQQAAPAEQDGRLIGGDHVTGEVTHMLGSMTGCRQDLDLDVPDGENVAVAEGLVLELKVGSVAGHDLGTCARLQLTTAADEVVVDVGLEDVGDAHLRGSGRVEVAVDVSERIDEGRDPGPFGDHQVGGVSEPLVDELLNLHRAPPACAPVAWL